MRVFLHCGPHQDASPWLPAWQQGGVASEPMASLSLSWCFRWCKYNLFHFRKWVIVQMVQIIGFPTKLMRGNFRVVIFQLPCVGSMVSKFALSSFLQLETFLWLNLRFACLYKCRRKHGADDVFPAPQLLQVYAVSKSIHSLQDLLLLPGERHRWGVYLSPTY